MSWAPTGWRDASTANGCEIVAEAEEPALAPGPLGNVDDHGSIPSSVVEQGGRLPKFYTRWNQVPRRPLFHSAIGLACSDDGGTQVADRIGGGGERALSALISEDGR